MPTGGNALTGATYDASTGVITFAKGTFLTAHQSLASYYTKAEIDAKGYTTNKGTVTSVGLTLPTGLVCATKTITTSGTFAISLASGYSIPTTTKQTAWDGAVSAKHTHSNKSVLDGISSVKVTHWDSAYDWYALMTTDEETADGIINKWNEVVSFLANIAQTDTLSGIVDGINKSISDEVTRAKKAEGLNASGISTNKTSITTLQGYFTSGSAKKALQLTNARKLWGNSFNGTADINGSIIVPDGKYISIGNIKMEYDATNKALKITNTTTNEVANLYTSGGVSAYGVGTSSSSGGGLNGSVKAYADAIKLTTENLSEIASAYSVAKLYSEIQNVASAVPSISVSVPTGGNALTGATYDASTGVITFAKGTFLTAHQSLDGYVNAIAVSGSGNAVTAISKSGKTISVTKGTTFLTSHQSLDGYVNEVATSGTGNAITSVSKSGKKLTFTKGATFLTSHQSLSAYLKSADAANTYSKLGHTHSYAGSASAGGDATRALKLKDYNGSYDIYCGYSGAGLLSDEIGNMAGIKRVDNIVYYKDVSKGELQKWLNLGARAYDNTNYLPLSGGTMSNGARISHGGSLYLGKSDNSGWVYTQDIASQSGFGNWSIRTNGAAHFGDIYLYCKSDGATIETGAIDRFVGPLCLNWNSAQNVIVCNGGGTFICKTNILSTGGITAYSSSDIRLKQDLRKLDYLGIIKAMGGTFGFAWKKDNTRSIGWIAQHVLCNPHLKDIVETDEKGYYKINYWSPKLIATAFGAIEQVGDEVCRLKARVIFLESEVQRLSGKQDGNNKKRLDNKNINLLN